MWFDGIMHLTAWNSIPTSKKKFFLQFTMILHFVRTEFIYSFSTKNVINVKLKVSKLFTFVLLRWSMSMMICQNFVFPHFRCILYSYHWNRLIIFIWFRFFLRMLVHMYLINTEQREHLKLLRENSSDGILEKYKLKEIRTK